MTSAPKQTQNRQAQPAPSRLDKVEQGAKIFATAAIPVIVALGGWIIQTTIEHDKERAATIQQAQQSAVDKDKISLEYVKIAKDILTSTEKDVPAELTTWSWKLLDGVSPIKFDKDDLRRLIERKDRIPAPSVPDASPNYLSLAPEYDQMFNTMRLTVGNERLDTTIEMIVAAKSRYAAIEKTTGVPWFVIGIVHYLETGISFEGHFHNGDPLSDRTVNMPRGRPKTGQPPFSWEDSARDALELAGMVNVQDWGTSRVLYEFERYNGWGYRRVHHINTPYVWNCTSQYTKGRYAGGGGFDPEGKPPPICGGAALLKRLIDRQLVALK